MNPSFNFLQLLSFGSVQHITVSIITSLLLAMADVVVVESSIQVQFFNFFTCCPALCTAPPIQHTRTLKKRFPCLICGTRISDLLSKYGKASSIANEFGDVVSRINNWGEPERAPRYRVGWRILDMYVWYVCDSVYLYGLFKWHPAPGTRSASGAVGILKITFGQPYSII